MPDREPAITSCTPGTNRTHELTDGGLRNSKLVVVTEEYSAAVIVLDHRILAQVITEGKRGIVAYFIETFSS